MRKDSVNLERRGEKEEKRNKSKKFSWNWFRHRRKDNKIDRRAQLEKDMKDNWTELPTTLRRKQKMSQEILDEFMKDPDQDTSGSSSANSTTSSKPEVIYSKVNKSKDTIGLELDKESVKIEETVNIDTVEETHAITKQPLIPEDENIETCTDTQIDELYNLNDYEDVKIVTTNEIHVEISQTTEATTVEETITLELPTVDQTSDDWLDKEQQRVMQLLNHAVSEDSLLIVSTGSDREESSSEEDLQDDSGTDINNPSSSSSCTNEPITTTIEDTLTITNQIPVEPVESNYSNYEIPRQLDRTNEDELFPNKNNDYVNCDMSNAASSKTDSLLTSSEGSQDNNSSEESTIPETILFENADNDPDAGFYDVPVSIPRAELHGSNRSKSSLSSRTDEESTMDYYDSVVREGLKEENTFQVEIEVHHHRDDVIKDGGGGGGGGEEQKLSLEYIVEEDFSQLFDRMQFSTGAKWKKALLMQTLGRKPKGMATIMEETNVEEAVNTTQEQLTVREILKRFEELGCQMLPAEEKSATLKEIYDTLKCLEEKVRSYETKLMTKQMDASKLLAKQQLEANKVVAKRHESNKMTIQQKSAPRITNDSYQHNNHYNSNNNSNIGGGGQKNALAIDSWNGRPPHQPPAQSSHAAITHAHNVNAAAVSQQKEVQEPMGQHDGKHSLLQFAMHHFRASPEKFEMLKTADGSISGSLKVIESLKSNKKNKKEKKDKDKDKDKGGNKENDWTWKEQVDLVKFTNAPVEMSLLRLESAELSELAVECFTSVMRYMGDLPMTTDLSEVKCVYTILMHCHKHESLRDEVYCQLMKQTTNNKSIKPDSCQRGWRLFSIVAAYFTCSDTLKPYLYKYLETAAYDKRRAYHGTATVCLQNLRKTFRHGGRKNVPSVEELTAISAGRNSKRQIYQLPGGSERVVNTKSTTVVQDVIEEMCAVINVQTASEMEEFSLYCIVEGDTFTMPLARDEYILDVTTELHKNQQVFYLIFCRSVWHFPLRLDSQLYIEVVFNQIAPDYLEGLLLVMPGEQLDQDIIYDIAKMAALLHRAADMTNIPTMKETKFLLPKPALAVRDVKPGQWVNMVQGNWREVEPLQTIQAKAQVLEILSKWPLFGSSFFAVKRVSDPKERAEHILALNRHGVHFIDLVTHETLMHYTFSEVISTRKVKSEDGTLFLDMKCGNLMQQRITRLQTDQAHEISRLIRQYITMEQKLRS